jgi:hypothetical protein
MVEVFEFILVILDQNEDISEELNEQQVELILG